MYTFTQPIQRVTVVVEDSYQYGKITSEVNAYSVVGSLAVADYVTRVSVATSELGVDGVAIVHLPSQTYITHNFQYLSRGVNVLDALTSTPIDWSNPSAVEYLRNIYGISNVFKAADQVYVQAEGEKAHTAPIYENESYFVVWSKADKVYNLVSKCDGTIRHKSTHYSNAVLASRFLPERS